MLAAGHSARLGQISGVSPLIRLFLRPDRLYLLPQITIMPGRGGNSAGSKAAAGKPI